MRRIVVVGSSGSGKTTLAIALAHRLEIRHVEVDALHWGPNWMPTSAEILRVRVEAALTTDGWTIDGNYSKIRDMIWRRADTLIWLDYPMSLVFWRILNRSIRRCLSRQPLWNGNIETWRIFFSPDSLVCWVWNTWRFRRRDYPKLLRRPEYTHLRVYRFRAPRQTDSWLQTVAGRP